MTQIIHLSERRTPKSISPSPFRALRHEFRLTLVQAGQALGLSTRTVENLENGQSKARGLDEARRCYRNFAEKFDKSQSGNLLLGSYSVKIARLLLNLSVDEISSKYSIPRSTWLKYEANTRLITNGLLKRIESDIRAEFLKNCDRSMGTD